MGARNALEKLTPARLSEGGPHTDRHWRYMHSGGAEQFHVLNTAVPDKGPQQTRRRVRYGSLITYRMGGLVRENCPLAITR